MLDVPSSYLPSSKKDVHVGRRVVTAERPEHETSDPFLSQSPSVPASLSCVIRLTYIHWLSGSLGRITLSTIDLWT
jgi:hypothetical protein